MKAGQILALHVPEIGFQDEISPFTIFLASLVSKVSFDLAG